MLHARSPDATRRSTGDWRERVVARAFDLRGEAATMHPGRCSTMWQCAASI